MRGVCFALLALFSLLLVPPLEAQSAAPPCPWPGPAEYLTRRASPPDSALVSLGEVLVKVCYSRPSARNRVVMGNLVRYGRLWRTGANEPTVLWVTAPIEAAGVPLMPGRYLLFSIPDTAEWSIVFHHSEGSTPEQMFTNTVEQGRGVVPVERTEGHVESFRIVGVGGATEGALMLEWEHTRVRIPIRLPKSSPGG